MFEPEMVAVLEQARGLGQGGAVMVESAEFDYIVDLDAMEQENQVIPTPLHVLGRISPIFSPFFPIFCAFSPS